MEATNSHALNLTKTRLTLKSPQAPQGRVAAYRVPPTQVANVFALLKRHGPVSRTLKIPKCTEIEVHLDTSEGIGREKNNSVSQLFCVASHYSTVSEPVEYLALSVGNRPDRVHLIYSSQRLLRSSKGFWGLVESLSDRCGFQSMPATAGFGKPGETWAGPPGGGGEAKISSAVTAKRRNCPRPL